MSNEHHLTQTCGYGQFKYLRNKINLSLHVKYNPKLARIRHESVNVLQWYRRLRFSLKKGYKFLCRRSKIFVKVEDSLSDFLIEKL